MTSVVVEKSEFQILDEADSLQIEKAETAVKQALVYQTNNSKQLTYMGIKWLVLHMSQKGQPLTIYDVPTVELVKHDPEDKSQWIWYATVKVRNSKTGLDTIGASEQPLTIYDVPTVELVKHDPEDKSQWIWYATVKVRNSKTGLDTIGASEQPFLDKHRGDNYDPFGRTKAISKAERNAFRKQIPELEITAMLDIVTAEEVEKIDTTPATETKATNPYQRTESEVSDAPTEKQLDYLSLLGYTGEKPKTKAEASDIIKSIKEGSS